MIRIKKKLGIDLDCTLSNTTEEYVKLLNYYTGENYHIEDITEWDFTKILPSKYKNLLYDLFYNDKLWNSLKPLKDSQYYMNLLYKKYEVYVVTSTFHQNANIKIKWLLKQYPFIKEEKVIISHHKQMINVDLLVDDYEKNLIGGHYSKVLLDYPWNRNVNDKEHGIVRVYDWKGVYDAVRTLLPVG